MSVSKLKQKEREKPKSILISKPVHNPQNPCTTLKTRAQPSKPVHNPQNKNTNTTYVEEERP